MTDELGGQPGELIEDRPMPIGSAPVLDRGQRAGKAAFGRGLPHHVLAIPRLSPDVGEAEEVERRVLAVCMRATVALRAEVDEARLVGMQREPKPSKAFLQHFQHRCASWRVSKVITKSSANRTRVAVPIRRGRTSFSNQASSRWCRKMFERIGEMTPPCGVPSVTKCRSPSSRTPALSHLPIIRRITPSVTRWSRIARRWECGIESKYLRISTSSTQYC